MAGAGFLAFALRMALGWRGGPRAALLLSAIIASALWAAGEVTLGAWLTVPSPVTAEATARVGFDYVCVDTQHGATDYQTAVYMIQAIILGGSRPIVRR